MNVFHWQVVVCNTHRILPMTIIGIMILNVLSIIMLVHGIHNTCWSPPGEVIPTLSSHTSSICIAWNLAEMHILYRLAHPRLTECVSAFVYTECVYSIQTYWMCITFICLPQVRNSRWKTGAREIIHGVRHLSCMQLMRFNLQHPTCSPKIPEFIPECRTRVTFWQGLVCHSPLHKY